ncbi:MAG: hypothetical protein JWM20_447 [Patescibacteria group bacterium]|nr:hypothetical protein [Patescibacteria group bacterium]
MTNGEKLMEVLSDEEKELYEKLVSAGQEFNKAVDKRKEGFQGFPFPNIPELTNTEKETLESIKGKIHLAGIERPDELEYAITMLSQLKQIVDIDYLIYPEGYQ